MDVVEDLLRHTRFIERGVVPLAVNVVSDEPADGAARQDIAGKVLVGRQARAHYASGVAVGEYLDPGGVPVFVRKDRCDGESGKGMAGRETGVDPRTGRGPELAVAIAFERARAVEDRLQHLARNGRPGQRLEGEQSGLAEMVLVHGGAAEIEGGRDRH